MIIPKIIQELNKENGTNYKIDTLKKYKDNETLKKVLKYTYDNVSYTYGVSIKTIQLPDFHFDNMSLEVAFELLEQLNKRTITGNFAREKITAVLEALNKEDAEIFYNILRRDQRIGISKTQINKVFKNLVVKPPYMRCSLYNEKTAKKITYPAFLQLKADGMYISVIVENKNVTFMTRSGETKEFPILKKEFEKLPDGVYIGELTIQNISNRAEGNGLINSDNPPHKDIVIDMWDYITLDEYSRGKDKTNKTTYSVRLHRLEGFLYEQDINKKYLKIIPTVIVNNITEALKQVSTWMTDGYEGGILKDGNNIFVDHTSPTQLKLKLEIDADVRITGFIEGTPGTKREKTFGAITFETDDGKVKGSTSGFTDKQLEDFNKRRQELIGKVITVQFNDITKSRDNDYYALSHPRFIEIRNDKTETDTLERIQESKRMAMNLN